MLWQIKRMLWLEMQVANRENQGIINEKTASD